MLKPISLLAFLFTASAIAAATGSRPPNSDATANAAAPVAEVHWDETVRAVDPMSYGVDCPACFDPAWTHRSALLKPLAVVTDGGKPLIRLHGWGMVTQGSPECWLNKDGTWNAEKITSALTPLIRAGYRLMIDIPSGPEGEKDPLHPAEMASLAASLVKIVNVDQHFHVEYWELPNEREHILNADQMAAVFLAAESAMKKVDPSILVGGPATDDINVTYISDFVKRVFPQVDFVTCHTYPGDGSQPDSVSYAKAVEAVNRVAALRASLTAITHGQYVPIFVDEYNIGWDHTPNIANNQGAVYFSILQSGVIEAGGDVSEVWDFSPPHNMSIVSETGQMYPSGNLFTLMNRYFYGNEVRAESTSSGMRAYAVESSSTHALLLTNLTDAPLRVALKFAGWRAGKLHEYQISAAGYRDLGRVKGSRVLGDGVSVPSLSVTVLVH